MSTKIFCVIAGAVASLVLGAALPAWGVAWPVRTLVTLVVAAGVWWWSRRVLLGGVAFEQVAYSVRARWSTALACAVTAHAVWALLVPAGWVPWWQAGAALVGLSLVEWVVARAWEYQVTRVKPLAQVVPTERVFDAELVDEPTPHDIAALGELVLHRTGHGHYRVVPGPQTRELPYGASWLVQKMSPYAVAQETLAAARRRAVLEGKDPDTATPPKIESLPDLTSKNAEDVATTLMELTGEPMMTDWVEIVPQRAAGQVVVTATTRDVMATAIPYLALDAAPRDPDRMVIGATARGTDGAVDPLRHWVVSGPTGSGKSALENVLIAEYSARGHVLVGGAAKVWALTEGWCDHDRTLPVTVVHGMEDTLQLIAVMAAESEARQALPAGRQGELTWLTVVITESPRVLLDNSVTVAHMGRQWTAGTLLGHNIRSTLASRILWVLSAQDYDHDYWGAQAGSVKGNAGVTVLVKSTKADERRRAFGDAYYSWPNLTNPGEAYVQVDGGVPERLKIFYPQETGKRQLHDGPTVRDIALARADHYREPVLVSPEARAWYARQPRRMTPEHRDYLRGVTLAAPPDPHAALLAGADALIARMTGGRPPVAALPTAEPVVTAVAERPGQIDRIVELVTDARSMRRTDVTAALLAEGYRTSQGSVDNQLGDLVARGVLRRPAPAVYEPAR